MHCFRLGFFFYLGVFKETSLAQCARWYKESAQRVGNSDNNPRITFFFFNHREELAYTPFCSNIKGNELQPASSPRPGTVGGFVSDHVANVGEFDFPAECRVEGVWIRGAGGNVDRVKAALCCAFCALSYSQLQLGHYMPAAFTLHRRDVERTHTQVQVHTGFRHTAPYIRVSNVFRSSMWF